MIEQLEKDLLSLKDDFPAQLEEKLVRWNSKVAKYGLLWVEEQSRYKTLADIKDEKLALLTSECEGKSNVEKERNALISEDWMTYKQATTEACNKTTLAKMKYDISVRTFETIRSLLSSKNIERRFT